jgi:glutaredoxin
LLYILQVFTKANCDYCDISLRLLQTELSRVRRSGCPALPPRVVQLDAELDEAAARDVVDALAERTVKKERTVPQVFVDGRSVGGAMETGVYARSGALGAMILNAAKCPPVSKEGKMQRNM